jgi:hypothetical protein
MPSDIHIQLKNKHETGGKAEGAGGKQAGASKFATHLAVTLRYGGLSYPFPGLRFPEIAKEEGKGESSQTEQSILHGQDKTPWKEDTQQNLDFIHSSDTISQFCRSGSDHGLSSETSEIEMHSWWTEDWFSRQTEQNWWLRSQLMDWAKSDVAGNMDVSDYRSCVSGASSWKCADGSACSTRSARPDSVIGVVIDLVGVGSWAQTANKGS